MDTNIRAGNIETLKRDLILRFILLLSVFMVLLAIAYGVTSKINSAKAYDDFLLNQASLQRAVVRQYVSEINQTLIGIAASDLKMALSSKKQLDDTAKLFEKVHDALVNGGELVNNLQHIREENVVDFIPVEKTTVLALENKKILEHLGHVREEWLELKRIGLLSLRADAASVAGNPYVRQLLTQANNVVHQMDHVVQLMRYENEKKLDKLNNVMLAMMVTGSVVFLLLVYFVYSRIILPLERSMQTLQLTSDSLLREKEAAEMANAAKSEFLSQMSHELRTPMNAVLGFGQLLELDAEGFNENQRGNIKEILSAGNHLLNLINEVLDLAKIESGRMEVSMERVALDEVLSQCVNLVGLQAKARQLELIDHISGRGYVVQADADRFKQVLLNLLSNAVKYNREQGQIILECKNIDHQHLRVCVTDTGKGLTEDEITKLFTSFERLDASNNVEGTGIGLVISKRLIELMGGSVGVESTSGQGSTFWLDLKLADTVNLLE